MTDAQLILIERADGADWSVKVADRTPPIWSVWLGIRAIITAILIRRSRRASVLSPTVAMVFGGPSP